MKKFLISLLAVLIAAPVLAMPLGVTILTSPSQIKEFQILGQVGKTGEPGSYLYGVKKDQVLLGSTNYVQTQFFTLSGSGSVIGATTLVLKTFHNIDGTNLTMADFGTKGFGTIEPNNGTQEEQMSFTGVTQNANGTATLTGVSQVLNKSPYTETSGLAVTHPGGVKFVISNTAGFYNTFANKTNNETITGQYTFATLPLSSAAAATNTSQFVTLGEMNAATSTGGSNASTVVKGVVQEATDSMLQTSSSTGSTGARTFANGGSFAQTSTANKVPVLNGQGKLDPNDINTSSNYVWSGTQTFNNSVTFTTTTQATTTITGLLTVPAPINATDATSLNYVTSSIATATSSVMNGVSRLFYVTTTLFATSSYTGLFSIVSTTLTANTLGSSNVIHIHIDLSNIGLNANTNNVAINLVYGGSSVAGFTISNPNTGAIDVPGFMDAYLYANGTGAQKGTLILHAIGSGITNEPGGATAAAATFIGYNAGTASIDDTVGTSLAVTGQFNISNAGNKINADHSYIEIIR